MPVFGGAPSSSLTSAFDVWRGIPQIERPGSLLMPRFGGGLFSFLKAATPPVYLGTLKFDILSKGQPVGTVTARVRSGLLIIGALVAAAILAPTISRQNPLAQPDVIGLQNAPPSLQHPLGTDFYSRDVLSRTLYGARISLSIACLSVLLSVTVGTLVGLGAGFAGNATDTLLMRLVDAGLAVPRIFLLLAIAFGNLRFQARIRIRGHRAHGRVILGVLWRLGGGNRRRPARRLRGWLRGR